RSSTLDGLYGGAPASALEPMRSVRRMGNLEITSMVRLGLSDAARLSDRAFGSAENSFFSHYPRRSHRRPAFPAVRLDSDHDGCFAGGELRWNSVLDVEEPVGGMSLKRF